MRQIFEIGMSVPRVVLRSSVRHEGNSDWNRNRNPIAIIWLEPDWNRIGTGLEPDWNRIGTGLEPDWKI